VIGCHSGDKTRAGTSHLLEEPGTFAAASAARDWVVRNLTLEATSGSSRSAQEQIG
jgi:hypothetical protein